MTDHCSTVRRSSRRMEGHGKKECPFSCCKASPERPKAKKLLISKPTQQQQHQQLDQQHIQSEGNNHNVTGAKVKKIKQTNQHQSQQVQQQKPLVKKR